MFDFDSHFSPDPVERRLGLAIMLIGGAVGWALLIWGAVALIHEGWGG